MIRHLILMLAMTVSVPALAHAHLKTSEPAANATVHAAPSKVVLHFSEPLEAAMCKVEVKNKKTGEVVSDGKPTAGAADKKTLEEALKALPTGQATYEVSWKAVSTDTHRSQGTFVFTVEPSKK